jgi:hypothetical protein
MVCAAPSLLFGCHVDDVPALVGTTGPETTSAGPGTDGTTSGPADTSTSATTGTMTGVAESSGTGASGADGSTTSDDTPAACAAIEPVNDCRLFEPDASGYETRTDTWLVLDPQTVCPCATAATLSEELPDDLEFYITAPADWPLTPEHAPVVAFHHGNGQFAQFYDFSGLARAGFVVFNVETTGGTGSNAEFGLACAIEFAKGSEVVSADLAPGITFADATDCNLVVGAHSVGAQGCQDLVRGETPDFSHILGPYALRGQFLVAPQFGDQTIAEADTELLIVASAADQDIDEGLDAITWYDSRALEQSFGIDERGRAMVYSWGTEHSAFGGGGAGRGAEAGAAIVNGYVPAFAAAVAFHGTGPRETWWSMLTRDTYPTEVLDPALWSHVDPFAVQSSVDCDTIDVAVCETTPGCDDVGGVCTQIDCATLDDTTCSATPGCLLSSDEDCMHLPRLRTAYTVDQSTPASNGARRILEDFEGESHAEHNPMSMNVLVDDAVDLMAPPNVAWVKEPTPTGHRTDALLVQWGGALDDPGEVYIDIPADVDLAEFSHLSLRVSNILDREMDGEDEEATCDVASTEAVSFSLGMREVAGDLLLGESPFISTGRIVQGDFAILDLFGEPGCRGQQTMTTIRFPLAPFCTGVGATEANQLVLRFPETDTNSRVLIDTIELTKSPLDELAECGTLVAGWQCQVDDLTITETSCNAEPTPTCPTANIVTTAELAPLVELPGEDAFRGWYVQTPAGAVLDPAEPTQAELAAIRSRCTSACQLEYADRPEISANCDATGAFLDPVLVTTTDAHASSYAIPDTYTNGYWAVTEETLDCDLRTDCCAAFDEGLCPARMARVTEAREQVGRGQEWSYTTTGVIVIDSEAMAEPVMGDLTGTLGGSLCDAGTATEACPVYLGSATVELADPLTVSLTCGGQTVVHTLDALSLSLAQPAFGLKSHDEPDWSAFPPGSLVFDAHTVVDTIPIDTFLPNEDGVTMKFNAGWAQVPLYSHFEVAIDLPCNGEIVPVSAWFGLVDDDVLDSPPSGVAITVPSTLTCPQTRALTGTASDADGDLASVRWLVDDVLLSASTTSMAFTQDHDLTAVVRDARGATRTVTKHVDCL